jgi:outer membrane biosynthesis protein TonB
MENPLHRKTFWASLGIHLFVLAFLIFFYPDSKITKKFLVYGAHSKQKSLAYFRPLKAPVSSYKRLNKNVARERAKSSVGTSGRKTKKQTIKKTESKQEGKASVKTKIAEPQKKSVRSTQNKKQEKKKIEPLKKGSEKNLAKKERKKEIKKIPVKKKEEKPEEEAITEEAPSSEQFHFNVMGDADQVFIRYQKYVQQEIENRWKPPLGVPKGTECTVLFEVSSDGAVANFEIVKRSNMLLYDLSITRVAKRFTFDKSLWGKTFKVDFRQ